MPEYNGDDLYAWQVQEPDGRWSLVGVHIPGLGDGTSPLIARNLDSIMKAKWLAVNHAKETNQGLRLAHFTLAEVVDDDDDKQQVV